MDAVTDINPTPAQRCVRASSVLTGVATVIAALLVSLPAAWSRGIDWPLFLAFLAVAGSALVLAVAGAVLRGATQSADTTIVLIGVNIAMTLGVVVVLFNFRMGAP